MKKADHSYMCLYADNSHNEYETRPSDTDEIIMNFIRNTSLTIFNFLTATDFFKLFIDVLVNDL